MLLVFKRELEVTINGIVSIKSPSKFDEHFLNPNPGLPIPHTKHDVFVEEYSRNSVGVISVVGRGTYLAWVNPFFNKEIYCDHIIDD